MTDITAGEQRLGLLTSSKAHVIMRGSQAAWDTLRKDMWAYTPEEFDEKTKSGARAYGHEHEAEGAAKFWERHPELEIEIIKDPIPYLGAGELHGWLASSPDRMAYDMMEADPSNASKIGVEIKSPTSDDTFNFHTDVTHRDQIQHGLLCTGWSKWFLVVHHGLMYREFEIVRDLQWQAEYLRRAQLFHAFCYEDKPVARRRLSIRDLKKGK